MAERDGRRCCRLDDSLLAGTLGETSATGFGADIVALVDGFKTELHMRDYSTRSSVKCIHVRLGGQALMHETPRIPGAF